MTISQPSGAGPPIAQAGPATAVHQLMCPMCWQRPGRQCWSAGDHLARWAAARAGRLISEAQMAAALDAAGDVFTPATLIRPGGAR